MMGEGSSKHQSVAAFMEVRGNGSSGIIFLVSQKERLYHFQV